MYHILKITLSLSYLLFCIACKDNSPKEPEDKAETKNKSEKVIHLSTSAPLKNIERYISVLQKAYAKIGYIIQVHQLPAVRSIHESNDGKAVDGEVVRTSLIEHKLSNLIKVPVLLDKVDVAVISTDKSASVKDWESLKGKSIATVKGYWYFQQQLDENSTVLLTKNMKNALLQLKDKKVDFSVHIKKIAQNVIKQENIEGVFILEPPIDSIPTYHFINQKHAKLIPELSKALSEITGNEIEK